MMITEQEKKDQRIAMLTSLGIHGALFLLFFFMVAWKAPNPPLPEYGIELNFGTMPQGSGAVQPKSPVGSEGAEEEEPDQPEPQEIQPEVPQPEPVESTPVEQEVIAKVESPVAVEEKKKEEVKEPAELVEKPQPEKKVETKPAVDPNATYTPATPKTESENKTTANKAGTEGSQGDDRNEIGDKGSEEGTLDAKSLYGKQGGGGGPSLDLAGWVWDSRPSPEVPKNETGRIVFEIKVDENGDIVFIKTLQRAVSMEAEQACRKAIEKLSFIKTGTNVPDISTGKITFVISSK